MPRLHNPLRKMPDFVSRPGCEPESGRARRRKKKRMTGYARSSASSGRDTAHFVRLGHRPERLLLFLQFHQVGRVFCDAEHNGKDLQPYAGQDDRDDGAYWRNYDLPQP